MSSKSLTGQSRVLHSALDGFDEFFDCVVVHLNWGNVQMRRGLAMAVSISPKENASAVRAAEALMQKPHVNKENARRDLIVSPAKGQVIPPAALINGVSEQQLGMAVKVHARMRSLAISQALFLDVAYADVLAETTLFQLLIAGMK